MLLKPHIKNRRLPVNRSSREKMPALRLSVGGVPEPPGCRTIRMHLYVQPLCCVQQLQKNAAVAAIGPDKGLAQENIGSGCDYVPQKKRVLLRQSAQALFRHSTDAGSRRCGGDPCLGIMIVPWVFFSAQCPDSLPTQINTPCSRMIQANGI